MIKYFVFTIILALRLFYQPSFAQQETAPFASPFFLPGTLLPLPVQLISFNGSIRNNRVFLQWQVDENETAEQFEIEKSADGKTFVMAALVFGTDKPATDNYWFYEKANNKKFYYRIKMINKNKKAVYSPVIEIKPKA